MQEKSWAQEQKVFLKDAITTIENNFDVSINYDVAVVENLNVFPPDTSQSLAMVIKAIEDQVPVLFTALHKKLYYIKINNKKPCGYVFDAITKVPIEGVIIKTTTNTYSTNDKGLFVLKNEKETLNKSSLVEISHLGYQIHLEAYELNDTECHTIYLFEKTETLNPVLISNYIVEGISQTTGGNVKIDYEDFSILPGLIENDVLQTLQALPGISSVDETVSNINIRGGANDQNLVLWDGIKMYQTGHFFGLISSFNPLTTKKATLIKNGTNASLSDGVSGSIIMNSSNHIPDSLTINVGSTLLHADLFIDLPLSQNSSLQVGGRKALSNFLKTPTFTNYFERIAQNSEVLENEDGVINTNRTFDFYDISLRYLHYLNQDDILRINIINSSNNISFEENATLNNQNKTRTSFLEQQNFGAGVYYKKKLHDKLYVSSQLHQTDYKLQGVNANILEEQRFLQENIVSETGVLVDFEYKKNTALNFNAGYNFTETKVTNLNDIDNPQFRRLFGPVLRIHGLYGQLDYVSANKKIQLQAGLRNTYIPRLDAFIVEPRWQSRVALNKHLKWLLAGELKHQTTTQVINFQNDFLGVERSRWQLSNNEEIPIMQSRQVSTGFAFEKKRWLVSVDGYYKYVSGITAQSQGFQTKYEFTNSIGDYSAKGVDVLTRWQSKWFSIWSSYSILDATYFFETLEDTTFDSNFNITHSLSSGISFDKKNWKVASGIKWRVGAPTTAPLAIQDDSTNEIAFGVANASRLPNYLRLDSSILYSIKSIKLGQITLGVSAWNVINTTNEINRFFRLRQEAIEEFNQNALGTTFNALVRLKI